MSMAFSSVGKKLLAVYTFLFCINVIVLALSARVNIFQEFFFKADLFPLGLSIATLIALLLMVLVDLGFKNPVTARAPFAIALYSALTILWMAFNAFSTSRWRHVPMTCSAIPDEFIAERAWCYDVQALKAFIWIEWTIIFLISVSLIRYCMTQQTRGHKHIWRVPLSRYHPHIHAAPISSRTSDFLQFERASY